jgi:ABC-2 type transport system ATP-binding protein
VIVDARGKTKTFGETQAVEDVDLAIPQGAVVALLGTNGAGKTTTIRILITLLKPDSGTVTVAGHDALREPDRVRSKIGLAGQSVTMDEYLSALQNLTMIARLYHFGRRDARGGATALIERVGFADAANRPVRSFSGGMRRRFDLAASLIAAPPVLFLDVPTAGLDPECRDTAWNAIRGLVRDGTTVLLTTQYIEEADQLADTATIINHGRIITSDTPANLKAQLGGERLDIKLVDPGTIAKIAGFQDKTLPVEVAERRAQLRDPTGRAGATAAGPIQAKAQLITDRREPEGSQMADIMETIEISRRPEDVFAYATDFSHFPEWQGGVVSARPEGDPSPRLGAKAIITRQTGPRQLARTEEITEISPPRSWTVRGIGGSLTAIAKGRIEPLGDGEHSRVAIALDFEAHGVAKLLLPLVRRQARKQLPTNEQRLKKMLERPSTSAR